MQHGSQCQTLTAGGSGLIFFPLGIGLFYHESDDQKKKSAFYPPDLGVVRGVVGAALETPEREAEKQQKEFEVFDVQTAL